jgi:hypothetical protein
MVALSKFYNWVLAALVILSLTLAVFWQASKNEVKDLTANIVKLQHEAVLVKKENASALEKLKGEHNRAIADAEIERSRIESLLKGQIYELENQHRADLALADGLRKQVSDLNNRISTLSRPVLESYAIAGSDGLAECSAFTVEVENLARRYYAEREFFRTSQPINLPPNIKVIDLETGAVATKGVAVKIKASIDDFESVTP